MDVNGGSSRRAARPGNSTGQKSTSGGKQRRNGRKNGAFPPACGKQKRRQRTAEPSFRNGTHLSSVIASIVLSRRVSTNGLGPKDHARDSVSKVLIPDIELRRPAPHGTAFARVNGGDTCRHSRQL